MSDDLISRLRSNPALSEPFAITFRVSSKPGSAELVERTLAGLIESTLAEPGCLAFEMFTDAEARGGFWLFERWRSIDDLAAHFALPAVRAAFEIYAEHTEGPGELRSGSVYDLPEQV